VRILQLVAGEKWTGIAAVVFDQTAALVAGGFEAQYGFVGESPLQERLLPLGWARPLLARPGSPLDYAREVRRLEDTIRREKFDIVHAHATHDHYVAAFAVRGTPVRLARTIHNVRHVRRGPASRALFRSTAAFAFANRAIAEKFGTEGPVHSPVVDAERFRPVGKEKAALSRFGLPADRFLIGTIGKMAEGRGHEEAIAAAADLPSAALVHAGHGEKMPTLQALAARRGAADRNFWPGYQEEALPELYRCLDALLFTASGSEQGQRAILEAMASAVPVVALDVPGVCDLMTDGQEGIIVPDASGLPAAVRRLIESPETRGAMARKARARALEFTGEKFVEKAKRFYEGLMSPPLSF